jgi:hypothetical protein
MKRDAGKPDVLAGEDPRLLKADKVFVGKPVQDDQMGVKRNA